MSAVHFEVSDDVLAGLDAVAADLKMDRAAVLHEALGWYLKEYSAQKEAENEVERQIDSGNFLTQDEMEARFEKRFHRTEAA